MTDEEQQSILAEAVELAAKKISESLQIEVDCSVRKVNSNYGTRYIDILQVSISLGDKMISESSVTFREIKSYLPQDERD